MIKRLTVYNIGDALVAQGFSRRAALALATFLDEDCRENEEFDAVAVACEWSEFESAAKFCFDSFGDGWKSEIGIEEDAKDEEDLEKFALDYVFREETAIEFSGGILVAGY